MEKKRQEDQWSCKRSPDIWASYKHKTYKTWEKNWSNNNLDLQYSLTFIYCWLHLQIFRPVS